MISKTEVWKELKLDLPDFLDEGEREELNAEIGDYLVTAMLDMIADGHSPVAGAGNFKNLTEKYADREKGGDQTPNMEMEGDLLNSLTFEADAYSVKVGFWDESEAIKAYGHITGFKGHPWLEGKVTPRKLLPNAKEKFNSEIQEGIDQLIEEFLDARQDSEAAQSS